ncbi:MAG: SDR family NAD(P)-dependent oxidoreductase [Candidatus Obscuribacterales bacterium]|nr:SDR family NAD(P)-dependent oxidoreductase [Candidatus Obscuribacterales bacterium]
MSSFGIIAVTPPSFAQRETFERRSQGGTFQLHDAAIASAASRAGEIGVINLEFENVSAPSCGDSVRAAVQAILKHAGTKCGVKCTLDQVDQLKVVWQALAEAELGSAAVAPTDELSSNVVILTSGSAKGSWKKAVQQLKAHKLRVFAECVSLAEAQNAVGNGVDVVIAKGHEAAGRTGQQTTYVLIQELVTQLSVPVWAQGGIGIHTAAACYAAGAQGIVLDSQLLLTKESHLPLTIKQKIASLDGTETSWLPTGKDEGLRIYARQGHPIIEMRQAYDASLRSDKKAKSEDRLQAVHQAVVEFGTKESSADRVWLFGQDICFANRLATQYSTVAGVLQAIRLSLSEHIEDAVSSKPLAEGSPMAISHGTRFPLVQGAMTRVSDTAEFANSVAVGGALPFLALALMREGEVETLVSQTKEMLGEKAWGVGLLGFVPTELRQEQLAVVRKYKPPFALIAGGRPDQAKALEEIGIKTYLHVPSPALLESFIEMGSRRFIFEGKECGGHVGPRSSFVLWEAMIDLLLRSIGTGGGAYHILFAGGIHDKLSSAMVAAMAGPLAKRGVKVGGLMGTAYLFTKEAVESGAIVDKFQAAAIECKQTVLLETGPGHAIRCIESPYKRIFDEKREELILLNKTRDEVREELELMNLGRLRIASKGVTRANATNTDKNQSKEQIIADLKTEGTTKARSASALEKLSHEKQWSDGMYMIGQIASMHEKVCTIEELHKDVSVEGTQLLSVFAAEQKISKLDKLAKASQSEPIAIVGMSCLFPKATDLETYWRNILEKVDGITEVPFEQWDWHELYDPNPLTPDKVYSKWGGFLEDFRFDPTVYGIPPSSLSSLDPMQILLLEVTKAALADAGYAERQFPKEKTSVVLASSGHGPITALYSLRSMLGWKLSDLDDATKEHIKGKLPEWTEDSFPGYLGNVTAGRVANRFDLGGINFAIDAACASSLAALYVAMADLRSGNSDVAFLCAADTHNQPGDYLSFSKTHAFSPTGHCRTFDATADGIAISEGIAMLVLKRLSDAERDGDRIYAVVKGAGGSSDGRALSLTAPRPAGQVAALDRAYEDAGVSPSTVTLVEAHGTGTVAGDRAEIEALKTVFEASGAEKRACAVGSVKTMIGHSKATAGLASIIKVAKALHHKVLPPTMGVTVPNPSCNFENSPFYINSEARPWLNPSAVRGLEAEPRRAGVSAFGFGGTNFHAVLEEYIPSVSQIAEPSIKNWTAELFLVKGRTRNDLFKTLTWLGEQSKKMVAAEAAQLSLPTPMHPINSIKTLAHQLHLRNTEKSLDAVAKSDAKSVSGNTEPPNAEMCLSLVASTLDDLQEKISRAKSDLLDGNKKEIKDPRGIYFLDVASSNHAPQKVAFLFPGQGSQQLDMLKDLSLVFPEVRATFERASQVLHTKLNAPLSSFIFPQPAFTDIERAAQNKALTNTHIAQPAVGSADIAMLNLLRALNVKPDMVAGHSYGEYVALYAAGAFSEDDLYYISETRGRLLADKKGNQNGSMAAVSSDVDQVREVLNKLSGVTLANINSPNQCVISGEQKEIDNAINVCKENGLAAKMIAVSQAFHSSHMLHAKEPLKAALDEMDIKATQIPVYSNTDGNVYPPSPSHIAQKLSDHIVSPVDFVTEIENMYANGARIFVEVGPGSILTGLVTSILQKQSGREFLAIATDRAQRNGLTQLLHTLAQLAAYGVAVDPGILFRNRIDERQSILDTQNAGTVPAKSKLLFSVNSVAIKRIDGDKTTVISTAKATSPNSQPATTGTKAPVAAFKPNQTTNTQTPTQRWQMTENPKTLTLKETSSNGAQTPQNNGHNGHQEGLQPAPNLFVNQQTTPGFGNPAAPLNIANVANVMQPLPQAFDQTRGGQSDQVMMHFQQTMLQMTQSFLVTQQQVMMTYLQTRNGQPQANTFARPSYTPNMQLPSSYPQMATMPQMTAMPQQQMQPQSAYAPQAVQTYTENVYPQNGNGNGNSNGHDVTNNGANGNGNGNGHHGNAQDAIIDVVASTVSQVALETTEVENVSVDPEALVASLLEIVSQRTGYPTEMLDPTLDLEADLGIDSIKRVEILNSFRKLLPEAKQQQLEGGIEELAGTKTLEGIIAWIHKPVDGIVDAVATDVTRENPSATIAEKPLVESAKTAASEPSTTPTEVNPEVGDVKKNGTHGQSLASLDALFEQKAVVPTEMKRALVEVCELPRVETKKLSGTYVIAATEISTAQAIAASLKKQGAEGVSVIHDANPDATQAQQTKFGYTADLKNAAQIADLIARIKKANTTVNGLIHAVALAENDETENSEDSLGAKSLFALAKGFESELTEAGKQSAILTVTRLGGTFHSRSKSFTANICGKATQAGCVGVSKTLAKEWTTVACKTVDFEKDASDSFIAETVTTEIGQKDRAAEVGYSNGKRLGLNVAYAEISGQTKANSLKQIDSNSVVLITGGARGITAEIAKTLAREYKPTLVLIGRAKQPSAHEEEHTRGLTTAKDIKAAIMAQIKKDGKPLSIVIVEKKYQSLLREREIRENIASITKLGGRVVYKSVDVLLADELTAAVAEVYTQFGRIDGVVHGAGIIEDGFVKQKTLDSFERVYDTKVESAYTLSKTLKLSELKFFFLFSSIVGRTGNAGQTDYVAANEVVNKLAIELDEKTKGRVASLMWGPWKGGMANPELETIFARYGWGMIAPEDGSRSFLDELHKGQKGEVEVMLVAELKDQGEAPTPTGARMHHATARKTGILSSEFAVTLNAAIDTYLQDHAFDGVPVMPMAFSLELMAESIKSTFPDWKIEKVISLDIPSGIVFDTTNKHVVVDVSETSRTQDTILASAVLSTAVPRKRMNFKATFELKPIATASEKDTSKRYADLPAHIKGQVEPDTLLQFDERLETLPSVSDVYGSWLFHGPRFQHIRSIDAMGIDGIAGRLLASQTANCLSEPGSDSWQIDPILVDSAMQLAGTWARQYLDITALPTGFKKLHLFDERFGENFFARVFVDPRKTTSTDTTCDVAVYAENGNLAFLIEGLGGVGSKSLNRLASQAASPGKNR